MISKGLFKKLTELGFGFEDVYKDKGMTYAVLYHIIDDIQSDNGEEYEINIDISVPVSSDDTFCNAIQTEYATEQAWKESLMIYEENGNGGHISDLPDAEEAFAKIPDRIYKEVRDSFESLLAIRPDTIQAATNAPSVNEFDLSYDKMVEPEKIG